MISLFKRAPMLVAALLSVVLTLGAALPALSQEIAPERLALARQYIDLTDHSGIYEQTIVQAGVNTYQQLLQQNPALEPAISSAVTQILGEYRGQKDGLMNDLARIYAITFDQDELQAIVAFYDSPVGRKLSKANAELNATIQRVMNIFAANTNKEFFAKVRAKLKEQGLNF